MAFREDPPPEGCGIGCAVLIGLLMWAPIVALVVEVVT